MNKIEKTPKVKLIEELKEEGDKSAYILENCHGLTIEEIGDICETYNIELIWSSLYDEWRKMWELDGYDARDDDDIEKMEELPHFEKSKSGNYVYEYLAFNNCRPTCIDDHIISGYNNESCEGIFVYEDISWEESEKKDKDK